MDVSRPIPDNLRRLWAAEDDLTEWAEGIIAAEPNLIDHLDLIEAYMDCVQSIRIVIPSGNRHIALGGLYLRQFDSLSHGVRAALSGNYTGCVMYARDLLETEFLLDYLLDSEERPEAWLSASKDVIRNKYGAGKIRLELDKRDGFKAQKRKARFDMLSAMGSHPTPSSLDLKRDGTRAINAGPFKQADTLRQCVEELARGCAGGGGRLVRYCNAEIPAGTNRSSRLAITLQRTYERYIKH